ncbi:uncharacterized protein LOC128240337 [Mya arenaria]|uniref:uncharacterized protein LOC128240337 n=1 Tax=Mya arenaria TaxID=6604 RepID=UPI0022E8E7D0|nr:uncharacterized protein LOC128240337 [Mya arenaria]
MLISSLSGTEKAEEFYCERSKLDMAEQKEGICHLYIWEKRAMFSFSRQIEHAAFGTPSGTYISIHPARIQGFRPNPVMIKHSLREDIKDKQHPTHILALLGLNTKGIDEWYKTFDKTHAEFEELTQDYSTLATALSKGSVFFKTFFTEHKSKVDPTIIAEVAGKYTDEMLHKDVNKAESAAKNGGK